MDKKILILIFIAIILLIGIGFEVYSNSNKQVNCTGNTTNATEVNVTKINNDTTNQQEEKHVYGYCTISGAVLSYSEANDDYTQGKVCHSCAINPYYHTDEGSQYANLKLEEAYPEDYNGVG